MNTDKLFAEAIANEYSVKTSRKVVALKKLDRHIKKPPTILAYLIGVAAIILVVTGAFCVCGVFGNGQDTKIVGYILISLGVIGMSINCPLYNKFLKNRKAAYAYEVVTLAAEICNEYESLKNKCQYK